MIWGVELNLCPKVEQKVDQVIVYLWSQEKNKGIKSVLEAYKQDMKEIENSYNYYKYAYFCLEWTLKCVLKLAAITDAYGTFSAVFNE